MYLDVFDRNPYGTNCWLLSAEGGDEAIVVDPGFEPDAVHAMLDAAGKRPAAVLLTHAHVDHAGAAGTFAADVPVYVHPDDMPAFTDYPAWGGGSAAQLDPVGDLVFAGTIGRSDFANSDPAAMRRSLIRFLTLPDATRVLPGHGAETTVGTERASNPFLREAG